MRFDKKTAESVTHLIGKSDFDHADSWSDAQIRRFMREAGRGVFGDLLSLQSAHLAARGELQAARPVLDRLAEKVRSFEAAGFPLALQELDVDGTVLMNALEIAPGPDLGRVLGKLLEHVIEHPEENRKERLLQLARRILENAGGPS
jgi:hypothetical protein